MQLGVIGCGKMAYAFVKGIYSHNEAMFSGILSYDIDSGRTAIFASEFGAQPVDQAGLAAKAEVVLLAVKPAQIENTVRAIAPCLEERQLIISVAAGIPTARIETALGKDVPVVRIMPNTPALVGEGMSALCRGAYASVQHVDMVKAMCDCVGRSVIVEERYMDAVTAVSGSGPAYAFLFAEAQIEAAVNIGLSSDIARQMVVQTLKGSIKMLEEQDLHPAVLKAQVCSPAGTTIAAVKKMEEGGIRGTMFNAIEKAYRRAIELGRE